MNESTAKRYFVIFWQIIQWLVLHPLFKTILFIKLTPPRIQDLKKRPLLIIANHKSALDPWFLMQSLPLREYITLLPIRFIATSSPRHRVLKLIYWIIIYPFIYWPNGVLILPPRSKDGVLTIEDKTRSSIDRIKKGEVVILFPEGRVYKEKGIGEFKRGPHYIQKQTGAYILPVAVSYTQNPLSLFAKRRIIWSQKPISSEQLSHVSDIEAREILKKQIYTLNKPS